MSLIDQIKADIQQITSNTDEFAKALLITTPDGITSVTIAAITSVIHLGVDTNGDAVNSKKAHISFSEKSLYDAGYPSIRNANKEVDLNNHKFEIADSTGIVKKYVVKQVFPNETIGLITIILEDFE